MGINRPYDRLLVLSPIDPKTSGGSLDLADGQIGLFRNASGNSGLPAVSDITVNKGAEFVLEVGTADRGNDAGLSNKGLRSPRFKASDVLDIDYTPAKPAVQAAVYLGYDNLDSTKTINLKAGEAAGVSIELEGAYLGLLGFENEKWQGKFSIYEEYEDNCGDGCTDIPCRDLVLNLVKVMRNREVRPNVKLGELVNIRFVSTCYAAPDTVSEDSAAYFCLELCDDGDDAALGLVQAQVGDGFVVERSERDGDTSTYKVTVTDGSGAPSDYTEWSKNVKTDCDGDCPSGYTLSEGGFLYSISVEDDGTDASSTQETFLDGLDNVSSDKGSIETVTVGAADASRSAGTYTTVTGTASADGADAEFTIVVDGSGAATVSAISDEGSGYVVGETITIADSDLGNGGADDLVLTVATLNTYIVDVSKIGQDYGVGKYSWLFDQRLTSAEIAAILAQYPALSYELVGEVEDVCTLDSPATTSWSACGTCNTATAEYYIELNDDICGNSRLEELQAAYPSLTITESTTEGEFSECRRRYKTTVTSTIVCDECHDDFYEFEAPDPFEFELWKRVDTQAEATTDCKCGIYVEGKDLKYCPDKRNAHEIATVNGQMKIQISGGEIIDEPIGWRWRTGSEFPQTIVRRAFDGTGWGEDKWEREKMSYDYFLGFSTGDSYTERDLKGVAPKLEPCKQYDTISLKIKNVRGQGGKGFSLNNSEHFRLNFAFPQGSFSKFQSFFNSVTAGNPDIPNI